MSMHYHQDKRVKISQQDVMKDEASSKFSTRVPGEISGISLTGLDTPSPKQNKRIHHGAGQPVKLDGLLVELESTLSSEQVLHIFQNLARLSRESDALVEVQKKEEMKTKTFTEISDTLKKISKSAEGVVEPQLSQSMTIQEDCKKRIEKNNQEVQKLWRNAVNTFVDDVKRAVSGHVQVALLSIRNEAEARGWMTPDRTNKRNRDDDRFIKGEPAREEHTTDSPLPSSSSQDRWGEALREDRRKRMRVSGSWTPQGSMDDNPGPAEQATLLEEMKWKVEQQAIALARLTTENNELRSRAAGRSSAVQYTPSTPSTYGRAVGISPLSGGRR
ncbi:unnamed protein product [Cyclocybe aegerita]|uniref:Uncharacterized protein n=1 Tax=Cyclocybe aegerita TaxID=1973307 RepID=A0A8S0WUM7_CYCAE|nr:unnamed protein product [Cyclocybe aegerita]